eukprot:TRINITY_DN6066_c0_g2_i1.p1 TRINITY_DN6066_c0_g2~~TRINITY_DN6066_c0_g2_i1.p1  ORF type:complete len:198 (+),score=39.24 TRINITY_DN6066_c0_g2_i1:77-670(+)
MCIRDRTKLETVSKREEYLEEKEKKLRVEINKERIDNTHLNEEIAELKSQMYQKELIYKVSMQEIEAAKKRSSILESELKEINNNYAKFEETVQNILEEPQINILKQELKQALIENRCYRKRLMRTDTNASWLDLQKIYSVGRDTKKTPSKADYDEPELLRLNWPSASSKSNIKKTVNAPDNGLNHSFNSESSPKVA